jgi:hypothetical protein
VKRDWEADGSGHGTGGKEERKKKRGEKKVM